MLRWFTAGESHGPALMAILEGCPPVWSSAADIPAALAGGGPATAGRPDEVRAGRARVLGRGAARPHLGGPVARDRQHRMAQVGDVMSPDPVDPPSSRTRPGAPLTRPAPATPIWPACRSTAATSPARARAGQRPRDGRAGGARRGCPAVLRQALGVEVVSHVVAIGPVTRPRACLAAASERIDADRCAAWTRPPARQWSAEIDAARKDGDTLGGVVEVVATGCRPGLGSHVQWDRKLDGRLAAR